MNQFSSFNSYLDEQRKAIVISLLALIPLFPLSTCAQSSSAHRDSEPIHITGRFNPVVARPNAPLWERYLAQGDALYLKKDEDGAKRYWLQALTELEKNKVNPMVIGHFPRLEHRLLDMYPKDWNESKLPASKKVKAQEEEVSVLKRLSDVTGFLRYYPGHNTSMGQMATDRYKTAVTQLNETKAELNQKQ